MKRPTRWSAVSALVILACCSAALAKDKAYELGTGPRSQVVRDRPYSLTGPKHIQERYKTPKNRVKKEIPKDKTIYPLDSSKKGNKKAWNKAKGK